MQSALQLPWHRHRCGAAHAASIGSNWTCSVCLEKKAALCSLGREPSLRCTAGCDFRACMRCVVSLPSLPELMAEARTQQAFNTSLVLVNKALAPSELSWAVAQRCLTGCVDQRTQHVRCWLHKSRDEMVAPLVRGGTLVIELHVTHSTGTVPLRVRLPHSTAHHAAPPLEPVCGEVVAEAVLLELNVAHSSGTLPLQLRVNLPQSAAHQPHVEPPLEVNGWGGADGSSSWPPGFEWTIDLGTHTPVLVKRRREPMPSGGCGVSAAQAVGEAADATVAAKEAREELWASQRDSLEARLAAQRARSQPLGYLSPKLPAPPALWLKAVRIGMWECGPCLLWASHSGDRVSFRRDPAVGSQGASEPDPNRAALDKLGRETTFCIAGADIWDAMASRAASSIHIRTTGLQPHSAWSLALTPFYCPNEREVDTNTFVPSSSVQLVLHTPSDVDRALLFCPALALRLNPVGRAPAPTAAADSTGGLAGQASQTTEPDPPPLAPRSRATSPSPRHRRSITAASAGRTAQHLSQ